VVVKVISEGLDGVDSSVGILGGDVVLEKHECDETGVDILLHTTNTLELEGSLLCGIRNARGVAYGLTSVSELLKENSGKNLISGIFERNGEDDEHSLLVWLDVESLVFSVVDRNDLVGVSTTVFDGMESLLERRSQNVTLEKSEGLAELSFVSRDVVQIKQKRNIIVGLGLCLKEGAVVSLKIDIGAVLNELLEASPLKRDLEKVSVVGVGGADVELNSVEVRASDIHSLSLVRFDGGLNSLLKNTVVVLEENHFCASQTQTNKTETKRKTKL